MKQSDKKRTTPFKSSIAFCLLLLQLLSGFRAGEIINEKTTMQLDSSLEVNASKANPTLSTSTLQSAQSETESQEQGECVNGGNEDNNSKKREVELREDELKRLVGRLFVIGAPGKYADDLPEIYITALQAGELGGFIAYNYNVENKEQITALNKFLSENSPLGSSFMRFVDLEGGRINRLKDFISLASPKELGRKIKEKKLNQTQLKKLYSKVGKQVAACGFTMNLGPVVDLHDENCPVIGGLERSYSSDPSVVVECAQAFIEGFGQHGITTCLKHFPGHSSSRGDTHEDFVDVTKTFKNKELEPYKKLFKKGVKTAVMPAHVVNKKLDLEGLPATFSKKIIANLLRKKLNFQGLIVSDAMDMGAIANNYDPVDVACNSLKVGVNVLIYSANPAANKKQGIIHDQEGEISLIEKAISVRDAIVSRILEGDQELLQAVQNSNEILRNMSNENCSLKL